MKKILVVEDEKNIASLITETLNLRGYDVKNAFDGEEALQIIEKQEFDLIILDIMIPKIDGFGVMEEVNKNKKIPIIFLSAKNDISSKLKGLSEGGQDYITKPFEPLELLARVKLRIDKDLDKIYKYKDITVNIEERTIYIGSNQIDLTLKEYELFLLLLRNVGIALSRDTILNEVWGIDEDIQTRTVDYHIQQVRKKLNIKNEISTINKIGYRLEKY